MIIAIILCVIPVLFAINRYIEMYMHARAFELPSSGLAIRPLKIETADDNTATNLKVAYIGAKKVIIEEIYLVSRLTYVSGRERILAWVKLAVGYFMDDTVGLKTVFGRVSPTSTWIIGGPVHRIENKYIRKPLSVFLGLVTVYFFIFYLIPIFWPLLWVGPYLQVQLVARDEDLMLYRGKTKLTAPFILDYGTEEQMTLQYRPSCMVPVLRNGSQALEASINYINEPLCAKPHRLPRANEFTWKTECSLYVIVESNRYRVDLGTRLVQIEL